MPDVAPLVGAWIEIVLMCNATHNYTSLPSWERGLKSDEEDEDIPEWRSLPSWERGLKFQKLFVSSGSFRRSPRGSVD